MKMKRLRGYVLVLLLVVRSRGEAGELVVDLGPGVGEQATVGVICRFDLDGLARVEIDPKAAIDGPRLDAVGERQAGGGGTWLFRDLPEARYDVVVVDRERRVRVEGFHYPPITDFDPFMVPATAGELAPEDRDVIMREIAGARHYENKVVPLFFAANEKGDQARVLMQLVRDLPTSFDAEYGRPVATARHEVWQYSFRYGAWSKDRKTAVLDRVLLPREEFSRWSWLWAPGLGGVEVGSGKKAVVKFAFPVEISETEGLKGWVSEGE